MAMGAPEMVGYGVRQGRLLDVPAEAMVPSYGERVLAAVRCMLSGWVTVAEVAAVAELGQRLVRLGMRELVRQGYEVEWRWSDHDRVRDKWRLVDPQGKAVGDADYDRCDLCGGLLEDESWLAYGDAHLCEYCADEDGDELVDADGMEVVRA